MQSDLAVVGGGIVGLATTLTWLREHPGQNVIVLEAESRVSEHQSGHNSGVIHSGIYYKPGSEKALLCRRGKQLLESFCADNDVPFDVCGKVVVATCEKEVESLERIIERATLNGVSFERIHTDRLRQLEPAAAGIAAIHVPETGIVDYRQVCEAMAAKIKQLGGEVRVGARVHRLDCDDQGVRIGIDNHDPVRSRHAICCGGLQSDRLYQLAQTQEQVKDEQRIQIVPFRGEYYELKPERAGLCRNLIYPVPDPSFPFLGVHFTRMMHGGVECGPNAVLAFARDGYRWRDIRVGDLAETFRFSGFRRMAMQHWRMGLGEMHRSVRKAAFVTALRRLIPSLQVSDLVPARSGVRAQAVRANGDLVDDFLFGQTPRITHVLNAPSPAATASLAIAERVISQHKLSLE